jgi:hypothetical protein
MGVRRAVRAATEALHVPGRTQEYAEVQATLIRRQVKVFRGITDRAAAAVSTVISLGRLLLAVHVVATLAAAAATWQTARLTPAIAGWLGALPLQVPTTDLPALVAVLMVDGWLWFSLVRIRRALGHGGVAPHQRQPAVA